MRTAARGDSVGSRSCPDDDRSLSSLKAISSVPMGRRVVWLAAGLALALALGVGSASGRSLFTTTVTVDVVGEGTVTSSPAGIACVGPDTCSFGFTGTQTIVLTPSNTASGWTFDSWSCSGTDEATFGDSCQITPTLVDSNHNVTATFAFGKSTAV